GPTPRRRSTWAGSPSSTSPTTRPPATGPAGWPCASTGPRRCTGSRGHRSSTATTEGATEVPRYLLSVFGPAERGDNKYGTYSSKEEMEQAFADTGAFNEMLQREGHFVFADGLQEATTATTVDGRGDRPVIIDGPYLETKEHIRSYLLSVYGPAERGDNKYGTYSSKEEMEQAFADTGAFNEMLQR